MVKTQLSLFLAEFRVTSSAGRSIVFLLGRRRWAHTSSCRPVTTDKVKTLPHDRKKVFSASKKRHRHTRQSICLFPTIRCVDLRALYLFVSFFWFLYSPFFSFLERVSQVGHGPSPPPPPTITHSSDHNFLTSSQVFAPIVKWIKNVRITTSQRVKCL